MNRYPTRREIFIIALLFAGLLLALLIGPGRAFAQDDIPEIPHPVEDGDDCRGCHEDGDFGAPVFPPNHSDRSNGSCTGCHEQADIQPPLIPHEIEGREACQLCHKEGVTAEGEIIPTPQPTPIAFPEAIGDNNTCYDCHIELDDLRLARPAIVWDSSIHKERDVACADCHGGDPNAPVKDDAKGPDTGFIGSPDRTDIPELCGSCHSNVNLMRQYDIPTDQLAKYRESQHGLVLATGDTKVATCFDCHDGHATREVNDPTASVYPYNVPELCAGCHSDEAYMAEYEIPTNQFELYESSVHGIAMLQEQDTRAPSCATCHGTHGAAPPGFDEVANVCGSCHAATQDYYLNSVHNSDNPDAPDCVSCHGRYDVEKPGEHMFTGTDPRHCGSCHEPNSDEGEVVSAMHEALVGADEAYVHASETVEQAARLGRIVTLEESLLAEARTRLITARAAQHTADLDIVVQQTDASVELSGEANTNAEEAIGASQFRRMMMGIVVAAIVLVIISLSWLRRELSAANLEQEQ